MFDYLDANIWGLISVPIGVLFCFGPALATWVILELRTPSKTEKPTPTTSRKPRARKAS